MGVNATVVRTHKCRRKVYAFDNGFEINPGRAVVIQHHAANLGKVNLFVRLGEADHIGPDPAATAKPQPFVTGDLTGDSVYAGELYQFLATRDGLRRVLAKGKLRVMRPDRRYDSILVKTTTRNARMVEVPRPHPTQSPGPTP